MTVLLIGLQHLKDLLRFGGGANKKQFIRNGRSALGLTTLIRNGPSRLAMREVNKLPCSASAVTLGNMFQYF